MLELSPISWDRFAQTVFASLPAVAGDFTAEDPLAFDYIAQQVGIALLPSLTTRSSRAQAFAMVLYGLELADEALREYGLATTDENRRALFERWERFWVLAAFEAADGQLKPGDPNAMRGLRGAQRVWIPGESKLPLDYRLISRQTELAHLGAYLAPLRAAKLIFPGSYQPTAAAREIVDSFWNERTLHSHASRYHAFALHALDPSQTHVARKQGGLTLRTVGEVSRLSSLIGGQRTAQQERLKYALLDAPHLGHTPVVSQVVLRAAEASLVGTRAILKAALEGRLGPLEPDLHALFTLALAVGNVVDSLTRLFDRVYAQLLVKRAALSLQDAALGCLAGEDAEELHVAIHALSALPLDPLRKLPAHGPAFVELLHHLKSADRAGQVSSLFEHHRRVQHERGRSAPWVESTPAGLQLRLATYRPRPERGRFPDFKFRVVRQLLVDCGLLVDENEDDEEVT